MKENKNQHKNIYLVLTIKWVNELSVFIQPVFVEHLLYSGYSLSPEDKALKKKKPKNNVSSHKLKV